MELPLGAWDLRRALSVFDESAFEEFIIRFFETVLQAIRDCNSNLPPGSWPMSQWTMIVDFKGFTYSQLMNRRTIQNLNKFATTYETHYPDLGHKCYFINCPVIFPLFMAILKRIVGARTIGRMTCYTGQE